MRPRFGTVGLAWLALHGLATPARATDAPQTLDPPWIARGRAGMVAADSADASRVGAAILDAGGNAFDAAIATSAALTVMRPESTGIGGGGFMLAWDARASRFVALDFRETAPAAATPALYAKLVADAGEAGLSPTLFGGNAVATPGLVAGWSEVHRRFGTRPWSELIEPAARLADDFEVDPFYNRSCNELIGTYVKHPGLRERLGWLFDHHLDRGGPPFVARRISRPQIAAALRLIAREGPDVLYRGEIAQAIASAVSKTGGALTAQDLADYRVKEREPLRFSFGGCEFTTLPLPSSGGIVLRETLNILDVAGWKPPESFGADLPTHVLIEALKHAFADRARWLGDADFADPPLGRLADRDYAAQLARRIDNDRVRPIAEYGTPGPVASAPADRGTSHFCVADRFGNVVAWTETINGEFGSFVVAEPFGIILNNEMDDFATTGGRPNLFGLIQGDANRVQPGKRPLSSMTPTIVRRGERIVLVLGASGGPTIITSVLQVALNAAVRDLPLADAITAPRIHHQWQPDEVCFDRDPPRPLVASLTRRQHVVSYRPRGGCVQAIQFLPDGAMVGACDPRKGGRPAAASVP